ncbi:MAG: hypothetical protein IKN63_04645 [Bacilli bacterium]|nr:hypothetical protein [Bacilli bacterium]
MADLVYNQSNFVNQISRLDQNMEKISQELETFIENFNVIKSNWSGSEYQKAEPKLMQIRTTLQTALDDCRTQRNFLESKNQDFASQVSGL